MKLFIISFFAWLVAFSTCAVSGAVYAHEGELRSAGKCEGEAKTRGGGPGEYIANSLRSSFALDAARASIAESNALLKGAEARSAFTVGLNLQQTVGHQQIGIGSTRVKASARTFASGLNFSINVFDFGSRGAAVAAAKHFDESRNQDAVAVRRQIVRDALANFYSVVFYGRSSELWSLNQGLADSGYLTVQRLYRSGVSPLAESLLAKNYRDQVALNLLDARANFDLSLQKAARISGISVDSLSRTTAFAFCEDEPSVTVDDIVERVTDLDPRVRSADFLRRSAENGLKALVASSRGSMELGGALSNSVVSQEQRRKILSGEVRAIFTMPFADGGANDALIEAAQAKVSSAVASYDAVRRDVEIELFDLTRLLKLEREKLLVLHDAVSSSYRAVGLARGRYKSGVGTLLELLRAENDSADIEIQFARSRVNLLLFLHSLKVIAGDYDF